MSDLDTPQQDPNGAPATGQDDQPQAATLGQYIKDMSVENPNAPAVYQSGVQAPLDVQFNVSVNRVSDDVHEVVLKVNLKAAADEGTHYIVDLAYAGLFGLRNFPDEALGPFLLIEAPRLLFPFARQIVTEQVQNLGFPPVLLDPIDFAAIYLQQIEAQAGERPADATPPLGDA
jgi:preprotein translocase subunit SecB